VYRRELGLVSDPARHVLGGGGKHEYKLNIFADLLIYLTNIENSMPPLLKIFSEYKKISVLSLFVFFTCKKQAKS
jgi:hypothetical protein